jgi:hypothetical protein
MIGSSLAFAGMAACIKLASQHDVAIVQIVLFGIVSDAITTTYCSPGRLILI